jgi:ABC-type spermidine/putrescine transport system permease subunit I
MVKLGIQIFQVGFGLTSESPGVLVGAGAVMWPCLGEAAAPRLLTGHELY